MADINIGTNQNEKLQREYLLTFVDAATTGTANYCILGDDLEEYSTELNPTVNTFKNILGQTVTDVTAYEVSGSVEPYYARKGDQLYLRIKDIAMNRLTLDDVKTRIVEVLVADTATGGGYVAYQQEGKFAVSSYGGDTEGFGIPFELHYTGARTKGVWTPDATFRSGTFVADTEEE